jgi:tRNA U34 2-thiouridine synthase MnmA/TrmU
MKDIEKKREYEKKVVTTMIRLYCRGNHDTKKPCLECEELIKYACIKTDKCPRMATKSFCSRCPVKCYKPDMMEKIAKVMRYSGPRLILHHPIMVIKHMFCK